MTTQNNAAQAANDPPLSDEYVNAIIQRHGYDSPETVIARLAQWIGLHGGENSITLLMYEAHKTLSKLRAPVADERAEWQAFRDWAWKKDGPAVGLMVGQEAVWTGWKARAALASAPVAGEHGTQSTPNRPESRANTGYTGGALAPVDGEAQPAAYLTLDEEGSPCMLFFDQVEARGYCAPGEEPEPLFRHAAPQASAEVLDAVQVVLKAFKADEAQGYHTRDRQFAISILEQALSSPQASAEARWIGIDLGENAIADVRNTALEQAYEAVACLYAAHYLHGNLSALAALKEAGDDIRALKHPQAPQGQQ
ncbi:hypothetical protein [Achromobacter xylosoxidans]|uniref:Uncharacterized protein n=1 Tax=Alcaligenes xylosoxydans xylosoxydans TaxID=85698 RepID=A0A0X8P4Z4_ALCXX|nr:hypothetical protein [Achromobacter xylosoxidans]AMG39955.1 hypothetical protein AL504_30575 [Achromobacter xylosoxidans]